ncbi:hypothetical protein FACS1894202_12920 [Clostridia bacterium]|nr:hypothetical protein FACS1894202_12920 [Clostridia bacterium]
MTMWKRNAVVATVVLFVCVALYLSWSYNRGDADADASLDGLGGTVFTELDGNLDPTDIAAGASVSPSMKPNPTASASPEDNFFTEQRLSRQKARDSALSILKDLASQENLTADEAKNTNAEISSLATQALSEAKIEGLVISKGFMDCVAFINGSGIVVIVAPPSGGLTSTDVVKIQDVIVGETAFGMENIRVQEASLSASMS